MGPQASRWPIPHFRNSFLKENGLKLRALMGAPPDSAARGRTGS